MQCERLNPDQTYWARSSKDAAKGKRFDARVKASNPQEAVAVVRSHGYRGAVMVTPRLGQSWTTFAAVDAPGGGSKV